MKNDSVEAGPGPAQSPGACVADRLLATASDLFYREGIHAVGIQRVIEAAGVAKASLYAHYKSKDDLVAAYLAQRSADMRDDVAASLATIGDPVERILHIFDRGGANMASEAFRGCPFQNAESELACPTHPARAVLADHRVWLRSLLVTLVTDAGASTPEMLAGALLALLEGATARALAEQSPEAARDARWAAEQLLDAVRPAPDAHAKIAGRRRAPRARQP
jgi:AcrR family transcriptional regulator